MIASGEAFPMMLNAIMFMNEQMISITVHTSKGILYYANMLNNALAIKCMTRVAEKATPI